MRFNFKNKKAVTLLLTLLVIGAVLTGLLLVSQVIIRYSRTIKGFEVSEKAYFAAESATEIAAYDILKNHKDYSSYTLSGSLGEDAEYEIEEIILKNSPNPWSITLLPGQSFQLNLDINGASYPASLSISRNPEETSEIILSSAAKLSPLNWSQNTYSTWPVNLLNLDSNVYYYRLRINNLGENNVTYTITPGANLFVGFKVRAIGIYPTTWGDYERISETDFFQYQKFCSSS